MFLLLLLLASVQKGDFHQNKSEVLTIHPNCQRLVKNLECHNESLSLPKTLITHKSNKSKKQRDRVFCAPDLRLHHQQLVLFSVVRRSTSWLRLQNNLKLSSVSQVIWSTEAVLLLKIEESHTGTKCQSNGGRKQFFLRKVVNSPLCCLCFQLFLFLVQRLIS